MAIPIYKFTKDSPVPFYIKALIEPSKTWTGYFGKPAKITYAYPNDEQLKAYTSVQKDTSTIFAMNKNSRSNMEKAFRLWEGYANVKFVEDQKNYQVPIYKYKETEYITEGYSFYPYYDDETGKVCTNGIGINTKLFDFFSWISDERNLETHIHEIGHTLTLKHGFDKPFAFQNPNHKLISYSIMNYKAEKYAPNYLKNTTYEHLPGVMKIRAVTPMPWDIEAAQFVFGANPTVGLGDDLYELNKMVPHQSIFSWLTEKTIFSLPWDNGGIDTISAKGIHSDLVIDINPFGRSQVKNSFMMMPNMDIENVIAGNGENKIVLNALDNIVNLNNAHKPSTIIINPLAAGHDTIINFHPDRDKLVLLATDKSIPHWNLKPVASGEVTLDKEKIFFQTGTKIEFDKHNTITFTDVSPNTFNAENTIEIKTNSEVEKLLWDYFSLLPKKLFDDFSSAFLQGAGLTFILGLSEEALKYYGCNADQIATYNRLFQCLLIIVSGKFLPALAGLLTNTLLHYIGTSNTTSERWALLTSMLTESLLEADTPGEAVETFVKLAGAYSGTRFTLWAKNKAVDFLHTIPVKPKIQEVSEQLNAQCHRFSMWAKAKASECFPHSLDCFNKNTSTR